MADKINSLSGDSLKKVARMLEAERKRLRNVPLRPGHVTTDADHFAPEVYIALAPTGGIPAMVGDVPGVAECDVYRIVQPDGDDPYMIPTEGTRRVYNLSDSAVSSDTYVLAQRDKYGSWCVKQTSATPSDAVSHNYLVNGSFTFAQYVTSPTATSGLQSGNYAHDRWFVLSEANFSMAANLSASPVQYGRFTQVSGSDKGLLTCQVVENLFNRELSGTSITFSVLARTSTGNETVKAAVWNWNGTVDSNGAKQIVSSWSGNAPVFNTTSRIELGNDSATANSTGWIELRITATVPTSNPNNIICAVWAEGLTSGVSLWLGRAGLYTGTYDSWTEPNPGDEFDRCTRYYYRPMFRELRGFYSGLSANEFRSQIFSTPCYMRTEPTLVHPYVSFGTVTNTSFAFVVDRTQAVATGTLSTFLLKPATTGGLSAHRTKDYWLFVGTNGTANVTSGDTGYFLGVEYIELNAEL